MFDLDKIKGMVVDGIAGSEAIDSSGEILSVKGADISDFQNGTAVINYEHADSERVGASALDIVGRVVFAHKIYGPEDCETERQKEFWEKVQLPYIYFVGVLADEAGHVGAQAAAALIRNDIANGLMPLCRWSVEGSTLEQKDHNLLRTVCRRLALTLKPCNRTAATGILSDPTAPKGFEPSTKVDKPTVDLLEEIASRYGAHAAIDVSKAERDTEDELMYHKLGSSWEDSYDPSALSKALEAGTPSGAPGTLTNGSALQREDQRWGYHATSPENLDSIRQQGLVPQVATGKGPKNPHVFFSGEEELAEDYGDEVLRFPHPSNAIAYPGEDQGITEFASPQGIAPGVIQHRQPNGSWRPLSKLGKALEAGGYNAAPGTLTGGAALQREDISERAKRLHDVTSAAKGALRDWWGGESQRGTTLRSFLKMRLPEASDAFLKRFADVVDDYRVRGIGRDAVLKAELDKGDFIPFPVADRQVGPRKEGPPASVHHLPAPEKPAAPAAKPTNVVKPEFEHWQGPAPKNTDTEMDPRSKAPRFPLPEARLGGMGGGTVYDYTPNYPELQHQGYQLLVHHTPGKADDYMAGQLLHNGRQVYQNWRYPGVPSLMAGGGSGNFATPQDVVPHQDASQALYEALGSHAAHAERRKLADIAAKRKAAEEEDMDKSETPLEKARRTGAVGGPKAGDAKELGQGNADFNPEELEAGGEEEGEAPEDAAKTHIVVPTKYRKLHAMSGMPALVSPKLTRGRHPFFDPDQGVLHTRMGSFPMHIPKDATYHAILNSPEVQGPHGEAMKNWIQLHHILKSGQLPQEVAMHASLFSGQSPSNPVPMQEIGYAHVNDLMTGGMNPMVAGGVRPEHRQQYMNAVLPDTAHLPVYEREHFAGPGGEGTRYQTSGKDKKTGKEWKAGDQRGMLYPSQKWNSVERYHELHPDLVAALAQHGIHGGKIAQMLIDQKREYERHRNKAGAKARKGKDPGQTFTQATGKSEVSGFNTKTIRYLLGMLGAGDIHVPDTHFIRHAFGLPSDHQVRDEALAELGRPLAPHEQVWTPNEHLKNVLWRSAKSAQIGANIDHYYSAHHPAVKMVREKYAKDIDPEQAVFPGFWAHWLTIHPHEAAQQGRKLTASHTAATNHMVYWNAVKNILSHYGLDQGLEKAEPVIGLNDDAANAPRGVLKLPLYMKTALAQKAMEALLGETPATLFYAHRLLPLLLQSSQKRKAGAVQKAERLAIDLQNFTYRLQKAEQEEAEGVREFQGNKIKPGRGQFHHPHPDHEGRQNVTILGTDATHHIGHFADQPEKLIRIPRYAQGFSVEVAPTAANPSFAIEAQHGIPEVTRHPEQKKLLHGLQTHPKYVGGLEPEGIKGVESGMHSGTVTQGDLGSKWVKGPKGQPVFIKTAEDQQKPFNEARREAAYYNLGKEFFGMGDYLTPTAAFTHPVTGLDYSVNEGIKDAQHYDNTPKQKKVLKNLHSAGELDKLSLMNAIMGNTDRHMYNYLFSPSSRGGIKLIDHGYTLGSQCNGKIGWERGYEQPSYHAHAAEKGDGLQTFSAPVHPVAQQWVLGLKPEELMRLAQEMGVPDMDRLHLMNRLVDVKTALRMNRNATHQDIHRALISGYHATDYQGAPRQEQANVA